jgi:hypothetical protein
VNGVVPVCAGIEFVPHCGHTTKRHVKAQIWRTTAECDVGLIEGRLLRKLNGHKALSLLSINRRFIDHVAMPFRY